MRRLFFALIISLSGFAGLAYAAMTNTDLSVGATVLESSGIIKTPNVSRQNISGDPYLTQDATKQSSPGTKTPPPQGWYGYTDTYKPPDK